MGYTVYYILGAVLLAFIGMQIINRKKKKERKSRTFMDGYERKDKKD